MYRPRSPTSISSLEKMFLRRDATFVEDFLDLWTLQNIIALGKVNKRLHQICQLYARMRWNMMDLLGHYFSNPHRFMYMLQEEQHVLFGPAIYSFFDRRPFQHWPMDVCIHVGSMEQFIHWLKDEGFDYVDGPPGVASFETAILGELIRTPDVKMKSTGERNSSEEDRAAWGPYIFGKDTPHAIRIKIYVVRCEPYRHILSLRATGLMNYVARGYVVSLFPKSTFILKRSFISRQDDARHSFQFHNEHFWLEYSKGTFNVETIGLTHKPYENVEIGRRFVGDAQCWIIPIRLSEEDEFVYEEEGPSFEVLDWTSATTRTDSFLRIGEPEIWSLYAMQPPYSKIETVLLKGDVPLIIFLFDKWEPREIYSLGKANKCLYSIVRYYTLERWNVEAFIGRFTQRPFAMLDLLAEGDGIIFGPAVTKFFDRSLRRPSTIDICIHGKLLEKILSLLEREGYTYGGWNKKTINLEHYLWSKYAQTPTYDLRSSGERNHSESHRSAWGPYEFTRSTKDESRRINLHVVRCDPYRHILSMHSTGLMNIIGWNRAISLFPSSTFIYRRSFISAQDAIPAKQHHSDYKLWFDNYAASSGISIVGLTHKLFDHAETGQRFIGDQYCWIIPCTSEKECQAVQRKLNNLGGLSFEVLDWRSGTTRAESYLRIGEPRIWRFLNILSDNGTGVADGAN
ncbi:hypothetical protein CVT26_005014 [Gymnopilus dilepis]|uniref:Uncharacterized protein n=1 Tax=Gymnopilus dilepis TaxID=231916 RepID=A0A409W8A9_9AGAR|nr:hypothetical protein CVT26_005014 [Gymnopilus dilepis]